MDTKEMVTARLTSGIKRERIAYKAVGIVALVIAIILLLIGTITMIGGVFLTANEAVATDEIYSYDINGEEFVITEGDAMAVAGVGVMAFSGFYLGFGFSLAAIAIVNLVLAHKAGKYAATPELTVKHAGSVGSIVIAALFNEIALIFVIINFVLAKKHRHIL